MQFPVVLGVQLYAGSQTAVPASNDTRVINFMSIPLNKSSKRKQTVTHFFYGETFILDATPDSTTRVSLLLLFLHQSWHCGKEFLGPWFSQDNPPCSILPIISDKGAVFSHNTWLRVTTCIQWVLFCQFDYIFKLRFVCNLRSVLQDFNLWKCIF